MPKVSVCVFCSQEIQAKEKWLDVPSRMNEVAHRNAGRRAFAPRFAAAASSSPAWNDECVGTIATVPVQVTHGSLL